MTGDNKLEEIELCYTGAGAEVTEIEAALANIKAGHYIQGAKEFYQVYEEFKPDLANCENMGDDFQKIEAWAEIFKHPGDLMKEAGKNWLLHHKKVKSDISKEEADWSAQNYFAAGQDTAAAIEVLLPMKAEVLI